MDWIVTLYLALSVFGVGIKIIDLFGLFGKSGHDHDSDHDSENIDSQDHYHEANHNSEDSSHIEHDHSHSNTDKSILYQQKTKNKSAILTTLTFLRYIVYFCLGFGPVGLFYVLSYSKSLISLLYAIPSGFFVIILFKILRKLLAKELDSKFIDNDFLMEKALVTASIHKNSMGKIRINVSGTYQDRYARASNSDTEILKGNTVRIIDITEECLIVEID